MFLPILDFSMPYRKQAKNRVAVKHINIFFNKYECDLIIDIL